MWTPETRARHNRDHLRYGSDLSDEEWQILASLLPPPAKTGRRWVWPMREMLNAIFYVLRSGCPWRLLPEHFPPHQTTYRWFVRFRDDGLWEGLNHHLVMLDRERVGGCDRQPIGENHGKRGSARLRRRQKDQRPQASRVG